MLIRRKALSPARQDQFPPGLNGNSAGASSDRIPVLKCPFFLPYVDPERRETTEKVDYICLNERFGHLSQFVRTSGSRRGHGHRLEGNF